jgi:hypothetical protein
MHHHIRVLLLLQGCFYTNITKLAEWDNLCDTTLTFVFYYTTVHLLRCFLLAKCRCCQWCSGFAFNNKNYCTLDTGRSPVTNRFLIWLDLNIITIYNRLKNGNASLILFLLPKREAQKAVFNQRKMAMPHRCFLLPKKREPFQRVSLIRGRRWKISTCIIRK